MLRTFSGKALGALAGALMLSQSLVAPASAFTLASPGIGEQFSDGQVDKAYWCRWGRCGYGWGYRRWGWGYRPWGWGYYRPYYGYYGYGYHRHCWMSPWGWRCRWW